MFIRAANGGTPMTGSVRHGITVSTDEAGRISRMFRPPGGFQTQVEIHDQRTCAGSSLFYEGSEGLRIIRVPAREGCAVLDDVKRRPENATLIEGPGYIVVWT
jgi:hypothetical protein